MLSGKKKKESPEPLITVFDLRKSFGLIKAVDGLSIIIPKGSIGLLGLNGAGKSTLIRLLMGLIKPDQGGAKVFGLDLGRKIMEIREKIGYMPEHDCLPLDMKAVDLVSFMGQIIGMDRSSSMQRAHSMLDYVGVGEERYRKIGSFSTGMKQRVKMAQALIHDPELIILDEPTNGMDPMGRYDMLNLIKDLGDRLGKSLILSSHLLKDVEFCCNYVIMVHRGKLMREGAIDELTREQLDQLEVRFKGNGNTFEKALKKAHIQVELSGTIMNINWQKKGKPKSSKRLIDELFRCAAQTDNQVRSVSARSRSLEDLFVQEIHRGGGAD